LPAGAPSTRWRTCKTRTKWPPARSACGRRGEKAGADPDRSELHYEDETHLETNPALGRVWHRVGQQPVLPAAGTNRRLTVFGSVAAGGRGRVEVLQARQDSAGFLRYLAALDARHAATGRQVILVLDNGPGHVSKLSRAALTGRAEWLEVISLARYSPELNPKEREWRTLKRDHRGHLAPTLRDFVDEAVVGLGRLGGERCDIVDEVPAWWVAGHRTEPTGRPPGRPKGAKDTAPRKPRHTSIPAPT
jgi:transposase